MSNNTIDQVRPVDAHAQAQREYFQEVVQLRLCLQWNADDYAFTNNGGRIVYLMDANVVVFFLNPALEAHHVDAFDSGLPGKHAVATALVTAEFLFSRGLNGQDGYPALIAASHAEELGDILGAMRPTAGTSLAQPHMLAESAREDLKILIQRVRRGAIPRDDAVKHLRRLVPEFATELLESGYQEANQFLRLYREDLIRALAVHSEATKDILDVRTSSVAEIEKWTSIILPERMRTIEARAKRHVRERGHRGPSRSKQSERKRARRDAEALIQTMRLDEAAREASQPTRYVLVTADRTLFDVYAKWFWGDDQKQTRFVLRHPLQYVPMLNIVDMPNGIERSDSFERTRNTLDTLLAPVRAVDPIRYPQSLSIHRALARVAADNETMQAAFKRLFDRNPFELETGSAQLLDQLKADWEEGFRASIVLNAELMRRRARAEFEPLECLLREDVDLRTAILEDWQKTLTHLETAHLTVNTRVSMSRLMGVDETGEVGPPRGLLAVRATFPRIVGNTSLEDVLKKLAEGRDAQLAHRIEKSLQEGLDHQTLFFAACLAHRCSRWHLALHYGERALGLLARERIVSNGGSVEAELHEIGYLVASATRYALPSIDAIQGAITLLAQGKAYARKQKDLFGLARALCEFSTLVLVLAYRDCLLGGSTGATDPIGNEDLKRLPSQVEETTTVLSELRHSAPSATLVAALETLEFQAWANVIGAEVISHLLESKSPSAQWFRPSRTLLFRALTEMEGKLKLRYLPVVAAEHIMARFWNGMVSRTEAVRLLGMSQQAATAGKHRLIELDEAEFKRFETILYNGQDERVGN
jgi:hypothetical protein